MNWKNRFRIGGVSRLKGRASVESRQGELIIAAYSRTTAGFWITNGQFERLEGALSAAAVGAVRVIRIVPAIAD